MTKVNIKIILILISALIIVINVNSKSLSSIEEAISEVNEDSFKNQSNFH